MGDAWSDPYLRPRHSLRVAHPQDKAAQEVSAALRACGPSLSRCKAYIEVRQSGFQPDDPTDTIVKEQDWAQNVMVELGFSVATITSALERFDWDFSLALMFLFVILLLGNNIILSPITKHRSDTT